MTDSENTSYISALSVGGSAYSIKDAEARTAITSLEGRMDTAEGDITTLKAAVKDGAHFLGKVNVGSGEGQTAALTDGCHTTPIYVIGKDSAITPKAGDFVVQTNSNTTVEFIWDGIASEEGTTPVFTGSWRELGSTGTLKALAFADQASTTYTPAGSVSTETAVVETDTVTNPTFTGTAATLTGTFTGTEFTSTGKFTATGTVSQPTFTGDSLTSTGKFTPAGGVTCDDFTPAGTVSTPTLTVELATTTLKNTTIAVQKVGEEETETLLISSADVTYATGSVSKAESTQPTFTGTKVTALNATFAGTEGDLSVSGTPAGTVSQPSFTGTTDQTLSVAGTPTGGITMDSYTPAGTNSGTAVTLKAHNHTASFSGTQATITVDPVAA